MTNYLSETWEWYQFSCKDGAPVISICMEVSAADQGTFFPSRNIESKIEVNLQRKLKAHLGLKGL